MSNCGLEICFFGCIENHQKLKGKTAISCNLQCYIFLFLSIYFKLLIVFHGRLFIGNNIIYLIFIGLPILTLLASSAGSYYAKLTNNYYIIEKKRIILLKIYDEVYIFRNVDLQKNEVGNELYIWRNEEIGKEKLVKIKLPNLKMIKS